MNITYEQFSRQLENTLAYRWWKLKMWFVFRIEGLAYRFAPSAAENLRPWVIKHLRTDPIVRAWNTMVEEGGRK